MEYCEFTIHRGETFFRLLRFKQGGETVDLSGYSAKSQVRKQPDGGELICEIGTSISAEAGEVEISIPAETTAAIESGVYVWDFRMTNGEDVTKYYLGGKFSVLPSVTE